MFLLDYCGLMTTLVLDFRVFVTAKCGLAEYTGAEVKVDPESRLLCTVLAQIRNFSRILLSSTSPHNSDYQRWLTLRPQRLNP